MAYHSRRDYIPKTAVKKKKSTPAIVCVLIVFALIIAAAVIVLNHIVYTPSGIELDFGRREVQKEEKPDVISDLPRGQAAAFAPRVLGKVSVEAGELPGYAASAIDARYIDVSKISLKTLSDLPKELEENETLSIVIDIKGSGGRLNYDSQCSLSQDIAALDMSGGALETFISDCVSRGIRVCGRICCLQDDYMPGKRPELALTTASGQIYADQDGHTWLDPEEPEVVQYIADVCAEAGSLGLREIMLDCLTFPPDVMEDGAEALCGQINALIEAAAAQRREKMYMSAVTYEDVLGEGANENRGQDLDKFVKCFDRVLLECSDTEQAKYIITDVRRNQVLYDRLAFFIGERVVSASVLEK